MCSKLISIQPSGPNLSPVAHPLTRPPRTRSQRVAFRGFIFLKGKQEMQMRLTHPAMLTHHYYHKPPNRAQPSTSHPFTRETRHHQATYPTPLIPKEIPRHMPYTYSPLPLSKRALLSRLLSQHSSHPPRLQAILPTYPHPPDLAITSQRRSTPAGPRNPPPLSMGLPWSDSPVPSVEIPLQGVGVCGTKAHVVSPSRHSQGQGNPPGSYRRALAKTYGSYSALSLPSPTILEPIIFPIPDASP